MDAILMSAGLGTRLKPLTDTIPKPLIPINGKGSLERNLAVLPSSVTRIIIVVGYLANQIREKFGTTWNALPVIYVTQDPLDGTGGCLRQVQKQVPDLSETFLVVNGDDLYIAADLERLAASPSPALLTLRTKAPRAIDSCDVSADGQLRGFTETPKGETGLINVGSYLLDHRWFDTEPVLVPGKQTEWSLPHALFQLLEKGIPVYAVEGTFWMPVGTPEELKAAEQAVR